MVMVTKIRRQIGQFRNRYRETWFGRPSQASNGRILFVTTVAGLLFIVYPLQLRSEAREEVGETERATEIVIRGILSAQYERCRTTNEFRTFHYEKDDDILADAADRLSTARSARQLSPESIPGYRDLDPATKQVVDYFIVGLENSRQERIKLAEQEYEVALDDRVSYMEEFPLQECTPPPALDEPLPPEVLLLPTTTDSSGD